MAEYRYPYLCDGFPSFDSQHELLEFIDAYESAGYVKPCTRLQLKEVRGGYSGARSFRPDCLADSFHRERPRRPATAFGATWAWYGCPENCRLYDPRPDAPSGPTASLHELMRRRDIPAVKDEINRALKNVETDPPAAITAACATLESLFKTIIADEALDLPADQSVLPLWKVVQGCLNLDPAKATDPQLKKMLGGLASVVHGIAELRSAVGSAHGRGPGANAIEPRHARLAIHSAHTVVVFVLESWK